MVAKATMRLIWSGCRLTTTERSRGNLKICCTIKGAAKRDKRYFTEHINNKLNE